LINFNQDVLDQLDQNECIDDSTDMEVEAAQPSKALDTAVQAVIGSIGRRERHKRNLVLDDCLCGDRVDPAANNAIQCKRNGCETVWVSNLPFITIVL
jgi:hypothetical protein